MQCGNTLDVKNRLFLLHIVLGFEQLYCKECIAQLLVLGVH